jgi:hypothetical protein
MVPIICQMNPVHTLVLKIYFDIILSSFKLTKIMENF